MKSESGERAKGWRRRDLEKNMMRAVDVGNRQY